MKKILIIDDDARNIFALSAVLRARKYTSVGVPGMQEALKLLDEGENIDVILLDMMMPDMDGYEGLALLRQHELYRHLPIVAVTAQAMTGDKEKCLAAGADDYISKPVDVDILANILNALK